MAKASGNMGGGAPKRDVDWKMWSASSYVEPGLVAYEPKCKSGHECVFRIIPEIEADGKICQIRELFDGDSQPALTQFFFGGVPIQQLGRGKSYRSFSAYVPGVDYSDIPVVALRRRLADLAENNDRLAQPFEHLLVKKKNPGSDFDSMDFPWPKAATVLQTFAYRVPGCAGAQADGQNYVANPVYGSMLASPKYALLFLMGTAKKSMSQIIENQNEDTAIDNMALNPGSDLGFVTKMAFDDRDRKSTVIEPLSLTELGLPSPPEAAIRSAWTPWDKALRSFKDADAQIKFLLKVFGEIMSDTAGAKQLLALIYPEMGQTHHDMGAAQAQQPVAQQPAEGGQQLAGWDTTSTGQPAAEQPASVPEMSFDTAKDNKVPDASEDQPQTGVQGQVSPSDLAARYSQFKKADG